MTDYRYGIQMNGRHDVQQFVAKHPVDGLVDVFYDPDEPQESLLAPGITSLDFYMPLCMLPFNLIAVAVYPDARIRNWLRSAPLAVRIRQRDGIWAVRVFQVLPITATGITALAVSFVSVLVVGFGQTVLSGWGLVIAAWCCVLVASLVAYILTKPAATAEINEFQQQITLQLKRSDKPDILAFTQVKSIDVRKKDIALKTNSDDRTIFSAWCTLVAMSVVLKTDSDDITIPCGAEHDARWLRDWLHERLGGSLSLDPSHPSSRESRRIYDMDI